jgi:UTP--glucose-1-phosphate uridylyltransferase
MAGAKSSLEVKDGTSFLDLTIRQIDYINTTHGVDVPLILMTSFNTHDDTLRVREKYDQQVSIIPIEQAKYPRIMKDSLLPCPKNVRDDKAAWYPPGHGDLYNVLHRSGLLDQLLKDGKQFLFASNSDNLGAVLVVHPTIISKLELATNI